MTTMEESFMNGFSDRGSIPLTSIKDTLNACLFFMEMRGIERGLRVKGPVDVLRRDQ